MGEGRLPAVPPPPNSSGGSSSAVLPPGEWKEGEVGQFIPFSSHQNRKKKAPTQSFKKKHRGAPGNPFSPKNAKQAKNGRAHGKGQPANKAAIQRAAGKRLFHGKSGSFAQNFKSD